MPSISEAINPDLSGYSPLIKGTAPVAQPQMEGLEPILNPMMRCPLPVLLQTTGDSQRQFYQGGKVPQVRFLSSQVLSTGGGSDTGNAVITNTTLIGGTGGSGGTVAPGTPAQQATVTTTISPGDRYTGLLPISKSFQLLTLSTDTSCRIQLYGTSFAQLQDAARGLDVPPPAGTSQNIICDIVLDTLPYQWNFQNRTGANADTPQQPLIYSTITNLSSATTTIRVTVNYVALETL
jgi:hypothetical protein